MRSKKVTTFLNDPEVGMIGWDEALKKYKGVPVRDMIFKLMCECGERVFPEPWQVVEELEDGSQRVEWKKDVNMFRIYHTLQTILEKIDGWDEEKTKQEGGKDGREKSL